LLNSCMVVLSVNYSSYFNHSAIQPALRVQGLLLTYTELFEDLVQNVFVHDLTG